MPGEGVDPSAALPECATLTRWERRSAQRLYGLYLTEGLSLHPDTPELVRDRAAYLGWHGANQVWMWFMIGVVVLSTITIFVNGAALLGVRAAGLALLLGLFLTIALRVRQSRKAHPAWRRYRRDPAATDWSDYGDLAPQTANEADA